MKTVEIENFEEWSDEPEFCAHCGEMVEESNDVCLYCGEEIY